MKNEYYVYNKKMGRPIIKHDSYQEAEKEARRLAMKEVCDIEVLKIIATAKPVITASVVIGGENVSNMGNR